MSFEITARRKFIRLMSRRSRPRSGFRLAVAPGGCSGLSSDISVTAQPASAESITQYKDIKLFMTAESRIFAWSDDRFCQFAIADWSCLPSGAGNKHVLKKLRPSLSNSRKRLMIESARQRAPEKITPEDALMANALLGGGLSSAAEEHLIAASLSYHHDEVAESSSTPGEALAPGHAAVLIGLYRFYFYKGRLHETLDIARQCLATAQRELNLPAAWRISRRAMRSSIALRRRCRDSSSSLLRARLSANAHR